MDNTPVFNTSPTPSMSSPSMLSPSPLHTSMLSLPSVPDPFASPPLPSMSNLMPLPPEATYPTAEEAREAVQEWAAQHNYAFSKRRSKGRSGGRTKEVWDCDRHGKPPSTDFQHHTHQEWQRYTSTQKTDCQFSINIVEVKSGTSTCWEIRHREAQFSIHNHSPSLSPWSHSIHRRLGKEELDKLQEFYNSGKRLIRNK